MRKLSVALVAIVLAASAAPAMAHHSAAAFDSTKRITGEGVVKEIHVINPHMALTLVMTDEKGTRDVEFEGNSVNAFYRAGWRPGMVKVGDKIKVIYTPRKDGSDGGFVMTFITAEGKEVGFKYPTEADNPISEPPAK